MTPLDTEKARALLGIDDAAEGQTIRRAYLRRLREFRPERDPQGFQRLRAAYELLTSEARTAPDSMPATIAIELASGPPNQPDSPAAGAAEPMLAETSGGQSAADSAFAAAMQEQGDAALAAASEALAELVSSSQRGIGVIRQLYDAVFQLHAAGLVAPARELSLRIRDAQQAANYSAIERASLMQFAIFSAELAALPERFAPSVRRAIADALMVRDLDYASEECWLIGAESRLQAIEATHDLVTFAPTLAAAVVPFLNPGADPDGLDDDVREDADGKPPLRQRLLFGIALVFLICLTGLGRYYERQQSQLPFPVEPVKLSVKSADHASPEVGIDLAALRAQLCTSPGDSFCVLIGDVAAAAQMGNCTGVRSMTARLHTHVASFELDPGQHPAIPTLSSIDGKTVLVVMPPGVVLRCDAPK